MKTNLVYMPDKTLKLKIPVRDVDQAKVAMKNHKKMLGFWAGPAASTKHMSKSAPEGQVGAKYRNAVAETVGANYPLSKVLYQYYTIAETSEFRTVYNCKGGNLNRSSVMTIEVGKEKNEHGKDLLTIHSTLGMQSCQSFHPACIFFLLIPVGLCLCTPCVMDGYDNMISGPIYKAMNKIQRYIHSYEV